MSNKNTREQHKRYIKDNIYTCCQQIDFFQSEVNSRVKKIYILRPNWDQFSAKNATPRPPAGNPTRDPGSLDQNKRYKRQLHDKKIDNGRSI